MIVDCWWADGKIKSWQLATGYWQLATAKT